MKKTIVGEIVPGERLRILSKEVDLPYEEKLLEVLESDIVEPEEVEVIYSMGVTTPLAVAGDYLVCSEGEEDARDGDLVVVTLDGSVIWRVSRSDEANAVSSTRSYRATSRSSLSSF